MNTKHTPGSDQFKEPFSVDDFIALGYRLQAERNAALAQRDDLLAALREAEATLANAQEHFSPADTLTIVRAAIAKAEGT